MRARKREQLGLDRGVGASLEKGFQCSPPKPPVGIIPHVLLKQTQKYLSI